MLLPVLVSPLLEWVLVSLLFLVLLLQLVPVQLMVPQLVDHLTVPTLLPLSDPHLAQVLPEPLPQDHQELPLDPLPLPQPNPLVVQHPLPDQLLSPLVPSSLLQLLCKFNKLCIWERINGLH